jgi:hypothetical protein
MVVTSWRSAWGKPESSKPATVLKSSAENDTPGAASARAGPLLLLAGSVSGRLAEGLLLLGVESFSGAGGGSPLVDLDRSMEELLFLRSIILALLRLRRSLLSVLLLLLLRASRAKCRGSPRNRFIGSQPL